MRKKLYKIHRLLGLSLGLLTVVVFLSGSAVVFVPEIDRFLNPEILTASGSGTRATLEEVVKKAAAQYRWGAPGFLNLKLAQDGGVHRVLMKEGFGKDKGPWYEVMVHPFSGDVLGERKPEDSFAGFLIALHVNLLLGEGSVGESLVGILGGILFLVFLLTGFTMWWPGFRRIRKGFRFRTHKGSELLWRDIHRGLGVISIPIVLVSVITGLTLVFPNYMKPAIKFFLPRAEKAEKLEAVDRVVGPQLITADEAYRIVSERFPEAVVTSISVPDSSQKSYRLRMRRQSDPVQHYSNGRLSVSVQAASGQIEEVVDDNEKPIANSLTDVWLFPLHTGELFGIFGRVLILVTGLIPMILYGSGLFVNRKRKKRKNYNSLRSSETVGGSELALELRVQA
jgi:uncharacterized iron-regulated membrane protein